VVRLHAAPGVQFVMGSQIMCCSCSIISSFLSAATSQIVKCF